MNHESAESRVRLDKWLWAARFFKTRGLATEAVSGGRVHVDGARVKPSRNVSVGQVLEITKGPYEFVVQIEALSTQRGPATVARTLYTESDESISRREELALKLKADRMISRSEQLAGRPSKRDRRQMQKIRGRDGSDD
jgi:ribosome-associated heat shock protein Hsp15